MRLGQITVITFTMSINTFNFNYTLRWHCSEAAADTQDKQGNIPHIHEEIIHNSVGTTSARFNHTSSVQHMRINQPETKQAPVEQNMVCLFVLLQRDI